tara:strand:- start:310 stop:471 length:162 start_codon:yes stop_codon:yes gene_type:complete
VREIDDLILNVDKRSDKIYLDARDKESQIDASVDPPSAMKDTLDVLDIKRRNS